LRAFVLTVMNFLLLKTDQINSALLLLKLISTRMKWVGHVERIGQMSNAFRIFSQKS